jgi:hypothetical protein
MDAHDLPAQIPDPLRARVSADLQRVDARHRKGMPLPESLREVYDVLARALWDAGCEFTDRLLTRTIPDGVFRFARAQGWLPRQRRVTRILLAELEAGVQRKLANSIAHWRAETERC